MEILFKIIDAMLITAECATLNEPLPVITFHWGCIIALTVFLASMLRLYVQFIKKARK